MNFQIQSCLLRFHIQWYVLQAEIASTSLNGGRNIMFFDFDVAFLPITEHRCFNTVFSTDHSQF